MDFTGRHVVITGASTGIGRATADRIVAQGGKVTLIARRAALLEQACAELGGAAQWAAADVGVKDQLIAALDRAVALNGPIDGLFLNAASGGTFAPICDYPDDSFEDVLNVNLRSPWWAVRHVLPAMVARRSGAILITGSLGSERGMAGNAGYVIAKHGLRGLCMAVAAEAAPPQRALQPADPRLHRNADAGRRAGSGQSRHGRAHAAGPRRPTARSGEPCHLPAVRRCQPRHGPGLGGGRRPAGYADTIARRPPPFASSAVETRVRMCLDCARHERVLGRKPRWP